MFSRYYEALDADGGEGEEIPATPPRPLVVNSIYINGFRPNLEPILSAPLEEPITDETWHAWYLRDFYGSFPFENLPRRRTWGQLYWIVYEFYKNILDWIFRSGEGVFIGVRLYEIAPDVRLPVEQALFQMQTTVDDPGLDVVSYAMIIDPGLFAYYFDRDFVNYSDKYLLAWWFNQTAEQDHPYWADIAKYHGPWDENELTERYLNRMYYYDNRRRMYQSKRNMLEWRTYSQAVSRFNLEKELLAQGKITRFSYFFNQAFERDRSQREYEFDKMFQERFG